MEGVMKQWKEEEEAKVEEEGLVKRQAHHMHVTSTTITNSKFDAQATEQTNGSSGLNEEQEFIQTEASSIDIVKRGTFHPSDPVISVDSTSFSNVRTESERVGIITENVQQEKELYLASLCQKTPTQGFYCPNCKTCIQKVLLLDAVKEETRAPAQPPSPPDTFRCSSCFSFLIPIGSLLFPWLVQGNDVSTIPGVQQPPDHSKGKLSDARTKVKAKLTIQSPGKPQIIVQPPDQVDPTADSKKKILQPKHVKNDGADKASNEEDHKTSDSPNLSSEIRQDEHGQDVSKRKDSRWGLMGVASALATLKKDKIDISEKPPQLVDVIVEERRPELPPSTAIAAPTQPGAVQGSGSSKTWEILKSIIYGGLVESLASLGIVTSSASSDATTLNILVLSLANLIGGLFILVHNIWDLKSEQPRTNNETKGRVDQYYQVLGKRENFYLHVFIAILSFIIFGLVPPLVYAFTFSESNNKDLKLAAVAGASAICITLLSLAKAHIQGPNTYLKTVLYYLSTGAMTSVVSYLAGELVKELIEKLGWFDTESSGFTLLLPEMSVEKSRFGSY